MTAKPHPEKKDTNSWTQFLESQVANRNAEIALLRSDVQKKANTILELQASHEKDTTSLAGMTEALVTASKAIQELEQQISALRETESQLSHEIDTAKTEAAAVQMQLQEQLSKNKKYTIWHRPGSAMGVVILALGMALGLASRAWYVSGSQSSVSANESDKSAENKKDGFSLSAKPIDGKVFGANAEERKSEIVQNMQRDSSKDLEKKAIENELSREESKSDSLLSRDAWMDLLSQLRMSAFMVEKNQDWAISQDYKNVSYPVVITRAQFRDVVSKTLPTALPSRKSDGLFLYDLSASDIDNSELTKRLKGEGIVSAPLCKPWDLDPQGHRRLSIVVSGRSAAAECLKRLVTSQWFKHSWEEISVVSLVPEARFSASYFSEKKFISFQEWKPDWISSVTVGSSENISPEVLRAQRLVGIARVLVKSSDVHIEIPAAENGYVSFGNFAVVPNSVVKAPVRATRISVATGRTVGKTVSQPVAVNARAVIINGAEAKPEKSAVEY